MEEGEDIRKPESPRGEVLAVVKRRFEYSDGFGL
jgi:hypothetical protein